MKADKKGAILITSLWILAILSILAMGVSFRISVEARLNKYNMDRLKALYFAKAGFFKCRKILAKNNKNYDSLRECGIALLSDKDPADVFTERMADGAFTVSYDEEGVNYPGMMDEERKVNINKAPQAVLERLLGPGNEEVAASIINWRSITQLPTGALDGYYRSLDFPYECKHAFFSCIEELMLVKGVTAKLFESIKDYITVYGKDWKININTATRRVMLAFGLGDAAVDAIITFRNGNDKLPVTKDDYIFYDIARQTQDWNITPNEKAILGNYFTTKSNYFRIESSGMVDNSRISCKAAYVLEQGAKRLEYYREY